MREEGGGRYGRQDETRGSSGPPEHRHGRSEVTPAGNGGKREQREDEEEHWC